MLKIGEIEYQEQESIIAYHVHWKYGSLGLYDEYLEKRFIIDHEQLKFDKNNVWDLFGIYNKPDGTFSDHEKFCIHDDLFYKIKLTHQDKNIMWKFISNEPNENDFLSEATEICDDKIQTNNRTISKKSPKHTLQRKRQKISADYGNK